MFYYRRLNPSVLSLNESTADSHKSGALCVLFSSLSIHCWSSSSISCILLNIWSHSCSSRSICCWAISVSSGCDADGVKDQLGTTVTAVSEELAEIDPLGKTFVVRMNVKQFFLDFGMRLNGGRDCWYGVLRRSHNSWANAFSMSTELGFSSNSKSKQVKHVASGARFPNWRGKIRNNEIWSRAKPTPKTNLVIFCKNLKKINLLH